MSRRIAVQQDQDIFEKHVFIFPPRLTNSNFLRNRHIPIKQNGFYRFETIMNECSLQGWKLGQTYATDMQQWAFKG